MEIKKTVMKIREDSVKKEQLIKDWGKGNKKEIWRRICHRGRGKSSAERKLRRNKTKEREGSWMIEGKES